MGLEYFNCAFDKYISNMGTLCTKNSQRNVNCDFPYNQKSCPHYISLVDFHFKEVDKLYWAGVDPKSVKNKVIQNLLIKRIMDEHEANENWREYVK